MTETERPNTADAPSPPPAATPLWEDLVDIFYAPSTVFARRRDGRFGRALLMVALIGLTIFALTRTAFQPIMDAEFDRQRASMMERNPELSAEQMEMGRRMTERFGVVVFAATFPLTILLVGGLLWIVGLLFDSKQTFRQAVTTSVYAHVPRLVQQVVMAAQGLLMDPSSIMSRHSVSLSPARFVDPDAVSPPLLVFLGRLDLFTLWVTALLAIGLRTTGAVPMGRAVMAAGLVWLIGAAPELLGTLGAG
jgi:hypothetical protein